MRIKYCQETNFGPTIEFTESGHVDMDVFDESDNRAKDTLAVFHDKEVEELCRPIIEKHIENLQKERFTDVGHKDYNRNDIKLEREEINDESLDIEFFWDVITNYESGFSVEDFGWDENATDRNDVEYDWEDYGFLKQTPKKEDFKSALIVFAKNEFDCFINHRFDGEVFLFFEDMMENIRKASVLYHELYFYCEEWE